MKRKKQKPSKRFIIPSGKLVLSVMGNVVLMVLCLSVPLSCSEEEESLDDKIRSLNLQAVPGVTHPADNPASQQKAELGRLLFWDPIMSGERNITCATCHHPTLGYADGIDLSIGPGGSGLGTNRIAGNDRPLSATLSIRNSTSLINSAFVGLTDEHVPLDPTKAPLNWHVPTLRSLEVQAFGPLAGVPLMRGKGEYDGTSAADTLVKRLKAITQYVNLFDQTFSGSNGSSITKDNIGKAIASFERAIVSNNSAYDRYVKGELDALTVQQKRGLLLYFGKADCARCHGGPMFSDYNLHNLGVKSNAKLDELGITDKGNSDKYLFRTPTLRNVALTAPYMHNGTIATLKGVVEFYNNGVSENPDISQSDIAIKPLGLVDNEIDDLVAFLHALTDDNIDKQIPATVPSGLPVGGN